MSQQFGHNTSSHLFLAKSCIKVQYSLFCIINSWRKYLRLIRARSQLQYKLTTFCNSGGFGLMWVGFFAHHSLASDLGIQSSCRNVSLNVFCMNFWVHFKVLKSVHYLFFALTRMRFISLYAGGVLKKLCLLFISPVCFIYDLSLPQPCHLNISGIKLSQPGFRHTVHFCSLILHSCQSAIHIISHAVFPPLLYILLLPQSGCLKFLLKWIILNSGLVEEEDRVNGSRGWGGR